MVVGRQASPTICGKTMDAAAAADVGGGGTFTVDLPCDRSKIPGLINHIQIWARHPGYGHPE